MGNRFGAGNTRRGTERQAGDGDDDQRTPQQPIKVHGHFHRLENRRRRRGVVDRNQARRCIVTWRQAGNISNSGSRSGGLIVTLGVAVPPGQWQILWAAGGCAVPRRRIVSMSVVRWAGLRQPATAHDVSQHRPLTNNLEGGLAATRTPSAPFPERPHKMHKRAYLRLRRRRRWIRSKINACCFMST